MSGSGPGRVRQDVRRSPRPGAVRALARARHPRRALLSAANIAITVTGLVAVLSFHATVGPRPGGPAALITGGLSNPVVTRDEQMLTVITIMPASPSSRRGWAPVTR